MALFSPKATAWHYIFTLVIGTQGIVLLLLFIYKRWQAYQRQQITTTSGVETAITHARSVAPESKPEESVGYDPVAYDYERPKRSESIVHQARQFVINKLSSSRKESTKPSPLAPQPPSTSPPMRRLRRVD